mgnify:CR=1 FL=1
MGPNDCELHLVRLQGAVEAARLSRILKKELQLSVDAHFYWTDSKIVLGYISNNTTRFHMFVANRVQEILGLTDVSQ